MLGAREPQVGKGETPHMLGFRLVVLTTMRSDVVSSRAFELSTWGAKRAQRAATDTRENGSTHRFASAQPAIAIEATALDHPRVVANDAGVP